MTFLALFQQTTINHTHHMIPRTSHSRSLKPALLMRRNCLRRRRRISSTASSTCLIRSVCSVVRRTPKASASSEPLCTVFVNLSATKDLRSARRVCKPWLVSDWKARRDWERLSSDLSTCAARMKEARRWVSFKGTFGASTEAVFAAAVRNLGAGIAGLLARTTRLCALMPDASKRARARPISRAETR